MATPDENQILRIMEAEGGECSILKVAQEMHLQTSYVRVILNSMGLNDIIDVFRGGKVRLARKGWAALGKEPQEIDGMQRYKEDLDKWKVER